MVALARLLRDCGLFDKARIAIQHARDLIGPLTLTERHRNRLETLERQTRMKEMSVLGGNRSAFGRLLVDTVRNAENVVPNFDLVLGFRAGQRPHRDKSYRLEAVNEDGRLILHSYGYGGAGITMSWGCAHQARKLLINFNLLSSNPDIAILGAGVSFVDRVAARLGRYPAIYGRRLLRELMHGHGNSIVARGVPWYDEYPPPDFSEPRQGLPEGWHDWTMWQYTDGNAGLEFRLTPGVGNVDRSAFKGTAAEL